MAEIKRDVTTTDAEGLPVTTLVTVRTFVLDGENNDLQPMTGSMLRQEFGVTARSSHKIFLTPSAGAGLKAGDHIVDDSGQSYLVEYVADWTDHVEAVLARE